MDVSAQQVPAHPPPTSTNLSSCLERYRIPFNHIAFLGIAKLIQAACAHFLREWIRLEHKPLGVVLWCILATAAVVLLAIERPWSRPTDSWKVKNKRSQGNGGIGLGRTGKCIFANLYRTFFFRAIH